MNSITRVTLAALAAAVLMPSTAMAQDSKNQGYVVDTNAGGGIVMSGSGLCWRDSDWTPARSVEPCDPIFVPVAAAAPAPVAIETVAVPPAPVEIAPRGPAQSPPEVISFSGDALFAFDRTELKSEGKAMLDELVRKLDGAKYDTVLATGHTDRLGSSQYNQTLSERRAQVVKDYLVDRNVQASRIDATGKGKSQPVTRPDECRGPISAEVVACLQPDRRVDVEMTGTRIITSSR